MDDCVFCKIVNGEIPCYKIYEDSQFLGFLDIYPANKGQALIIPKAHTSAQFSQVPDDVLTGAILAAKSLAAKIESSVDNVARCIVAVEGFDVDHFHIKIYPTYLPNPTDEAFGRGGQKANEKDLKDLQELINQD